MSSATQLAANQAHATHSTRPLSETGKAASSRNHLRHGFRSQTVLLPCVTGDDPAEYQALLADLTEHLAPQDLTETRFVREMADAHRRLRRVRQQLESALVRQMEGLCPTHPGIPALELHSIAVETLSQTGTAYGTWLRYETKFERQYDRAFKDWSRYQQLAMKKILFAPMPDPLPDLPEAASPTKLASNVQNALGRSAPPVSGISPVPFRKESLTEPLAARERRPLASGPPKVIKNRHDQGSFSAERCRNTTGRWCFTPDILAKNEISGPVPARPNAICSRRTPGAVLL